MKHVDRELLREVRAFANNDGTKEQFRPIRLKLDECRKALSTPEVMYNFDDTLCKYGRAAVAILLACTLAERYDRLEGHNAWWAHEVLDAAKLPLRYRPEEHSIIDDLHPTRIFEYAGEFFKLTSEEY